MYLPRPCVKETSENIQHPQNISCLFLFAWFTTQIHTSTVVQEGGWIEPLPGVFDMLHYFETILPLVESL